MPGKPPLFVEHLRFETKRPLHLFLPLLSQLVLQFILRSLKVKQHKLSEAYSACAQTSKLDLHDLLTTVVATSKKKPSEFTWSRLNLSARQNLRAYASYVVLGRATGEGNECTWLKLIVNKPDVL